MSIELRKVSATTAALVGIAVGLVAVFALLGAMLALS